MLIIGSILLNNLFTQLISFLGRRRRRRRRCRSATAARFAITGAARAMARRVAFAAGAALGRIAFAI